MCTVGSTSPGRSAASAPSDDDSVGSGSPQRCPSQHERVLASGDPLAPFGRITRWRLMASACEPPRRGGCDGAPLRDACGLFPAVPSSILGLAIRENTCTSAGSASVSAISWETHDGRFLASSPNGRLIAASSPPLVRLAACRRARRTRVSKLVPWRRSTRCSSYAEVRG
jgi:hypothetical protein